MRFLPDRTTYRALLKSPGFTVPAVVSLALAIGLTTTTYGIVDAVTHPPVVAADPATAFEVMGGGVDRNQHYHFAEMYVALRAHRDMFRAFAAVARQWGTVIAGGQPVYGDLYYVSANYFDVLGVTPFAGHGFHSVAPGHEEAAGAVIGYGTWRRIFGGTDSLSTLTVTVGDRTYPVVGVLPPEMDGPAYGSPRTQIWLLMPEAMESQGEGTPWVTALVRTAPGVTAIRLEQSLAPIAAPLLQEYGTYQGNRFRYRVSSMLPASYVAGSGRITEVHRALVAAAFIVLLIACANVANLLVARVISRRRDLAVRMAVGASRAHIAQLVLSEATVLAATGCAVGVLLSTWAMHYIEYDVGVNVTALSGLTPHLNVRVLLFSVIASTGTVLLVAWAAILRAQSTNVNEAMKSGAGSIVHGGGRLYRWLVVTEVAMSLIVLMSAGLLLRAVSAVRGYRFGYNPARVVFAEVSNPWPEAPDSLTREARYHGVLLGIRSVHGVRGAAWMKEAAPAGEILTSDAAANPPKQEFMRTYHVASAGLLDLLGVTVDRGRSFEPGDEYSDGVAIVDDSTAAALWPHMSPLGRLVKLGSEQSHAPWVRVIGVARSVSLRFEADPDMVPLPTIYVAGAGRLGADRSLVIRTDGDEGGTMLRVMHYAQSVIPTHDGLHFRSWTEGFGQELRERESIALLFQAIAVFALFLSTIGVYGMLAYTGAQRTREFAMRIALGAAPADVRRLVIREALLLVLGGTAAGGFVAMVSATAIRRLLYSVSPVDATALAVAEVILVAVSLAASLPPAVKAMRADPVDLLRAT